MAEWFTTTLRRLTRATAAATCVAWLAVTAAEAATVKLTGSISDLKGKSTYNKNNGFPENVTMDVDFTIFKKKDGDKYVLDTSKANTIQFKLKHPYTYDTSTIEVTSVTFGPNWTINKIAFDGVDTNEAATYRDLADGVTGRKDRTMDLMTGTLSGMIDFMNMTGSTEYYYDVIAVTDISDPMNPMKIEPIPPAYAAGFRADVTTFTPASIPKPADLKVTHVPLPAQLGMSIAALSMLGLVGVAGARRRRVTV